MFCIQVVVYVECNYDGMKSQYHLLYCEMKIF